MADPRPGPAGRTPTGARAPRTGPAPEYRVHRTGTPASRLPWKVILATAAAAFAIAATLLTLPELIAGHALFGGDGDTPLGGGGGSDREPPAPQETEAEQAEPQQTSPEPEQTEPQQTQPQETQPDERTTPTTPPTTTQPAQPRASPPAAPAPPR